MTEIQKKLMFNEIICKSDKDIIDIIVGKVDYVVEAFILWVI